MGDSNSRPDGPKPPALPTALIPDIRFFCMILCGEGKSKFFVSVGSAVVKAGFAGGSSGGGFPPQATVPRTSGLSLLGEWIDRLSSQSRRATNCATPGYEVVGWPGRILPKEVLSIFYSCFIQFIIISAPTQLLSSDLVSTVSVYSSSVCGLACGQRKSFGQNPCPTVTP